MFQVRNLIKALNVRAVTGANRFLIGTNMLQVKTEGKSG